MKKKLISMMLGTALVVSALAGCGSGSSSSGTDTQATQDAPAQDNSSDTAAADTAADAGDTAAADVSGPVTLTVLAGQSTTDAGIEDMIDAALAEQYPNITLEWECVGWDGEFHPKMQQYLQSGLPDIIIGKAQDVATYQAQGALAPIGDTYLDRGLDAARENVTFDGSTYGLVYNAQYQGVYYNKAMFEENGWDIPETQADLQAIIDDCNAKGITPFASHMVDTWSIGNVTMQFMMNDVFNKTPDWGDKFRAGEVSFSEDQDAQTAYQYNMLIFENTYSDTFSTEQTDCDARMVLGEAAMKVSGDWSIQNFLDIDEDFDFGIFPFPNQTGDSKLIFEPNIAFMTSATTENQDAVNCVLDVISGNKDLAVEICNYTKTATMLKDVSPTFANPSQSDVDKYASAGRVVDVTLGNNQLVWGGFQEENAMDIAAWLQGDETFEDALAASDGRVGASSAQ